jgi:REP element-mobilizing transposase RayT
MPKARKTLVSLDATPYYHCVSRCVRRAFLCGEDTFSGKSFEHRRQWIENRLLEIADAFAIEIAAYAIMSNHYHVVLHINRDRALQWTAAEVINHWHRLFKGSMLSQRFTSAEILSPAERDALSEQVNEWRERLMSISWFMRCVNEPIAREANHEDKATGRFWEGRFKSQALLDEKALAACMAYVDLNPIRARMANTPEQSEHTSIKRRIEKALNTQQPGHTDQQPKTLFPFVGYPRKDMPPGLPFRLKDYLELVDWSGRILREDKKGAIANNLPGILQRLDMDAKQFIYLSQNFEHPFKNLVGAAHHVRKVCASIGQNWVHGINQCEKFFSSS